jgi:hypothetical protein
LTESEKKNIRLSRDVPHLFKKNQFLFLNISFLAGNGNPMICGQCAQQLEASFRFLATCRQTILAAQVVVKQEPGLNFTDILSTTAHAFIPIKEEPDDTKAEDDSSLLIPGTVPEIGRKSKTKIVEDPDCEYGEYYKFLAKNSHRPSHLRHTNGSERRRL